MECCNFRPRGSLPTFPIKCTLAPRAAAEQALLAPPPPMVSLMLDTEVSPSCNNAIEPGAWWTFTSRLIFPTTHSESFENRLLFIGVTKGLGWERAHCPRADWGTAVSAAERSETQRQCAEVVTGRVPGRSLFLDCTKQLAHGALETVGKPGACQLRKSGSSCRG